MSRTKRLGQTTDVNIQPSRDPFNTIRLIITKTEILPAHQPTNISCDARSQTVVLGLMLYLHWIMEVQ